MKIDCIGGIEYAVQGDTESTPIIFLHGTGGAMEMFVKYTFPVLEEVGAKHVIALNLPGYGRSTRLPRHTVEAYVSAVLGFLDNKEISRCHLVGISLGGSVALLLAARHPDRVVSVTAQGAAYNGKKQFSRVCRVATGLLSVGRYLPRPIERVLQEVTGHPWFVGFLGHVFNNTDLKLLDSTGDYRETARSIVRAMSLRAYVENIRDLVSLEISEEIAQIQVPVLLTDGKETNWKAVRSLEGLSLLIPQKVRNTANISRAGHLAPYTNPQEFCRVLMDFKKRSDQ